MASIQSHPASTYPADLIDSKFNELAKRILDELKQAAQRGDFLQAIDQILSEPPVKRHDLETRKLLLQARKSRQQAERLAAESQLAAAQQQQMSKLTATSQGADTDALKKQCEMILAKQKQQQEQLDSHQQILFDSQYRSLPSEITRAVAGHEQRRANHKAAAAAASQTQASSTATGPSNKVTATNGTSAAAGAVATIATATSTGSSSVLTSSENKTSPVKSKQLFAGSTSQPRRDQKGGVVSSSSSSSIGAARQRSAIPQSTILSGIQQTSAHPLVKSATTTAASETRPAASEGLVRQASLKINKQTREAQRDFIKRHTTASLSASEKLRQRRPTKAIIPSQQLQRQATSDDSDLSEDDDDDDEDFEYNDLASRRAYLNQRFINQQQQQQQPVQTGRALPNTLSDASKTIARDDRHQTDERRSPNQQKATTTSTTTTSNSTTINPASQVARQKQRFSSGAPLVRSSTIGPGSASSQRAGVVSTSRPTSRNNNYDEQARASPHDVGQRQEPRSLGGLLTSHDIGQLYKPHMNYSTSLLGNHRLSDDDEIIIIPTAQSPSLASASVSPDPRGYQAYHGHGVGGACEQPDQSTSNMDEFSERFSISRTKSFWEKLANSKKSAQGDTAASHNSQHPQHDKQYQLSSSIRSISSSGTAGPNLVAVDAKASQSSLNAHENDLKLTGTSANSAGQRYSSVLKGAFDRMDSTGGSGNSHYSGCSSSSTGSSSGDEQQQHCGYGRLQPKSQGVVARAPRATNNPTINQLIRQDELSRTDKFRQTR